MAHLKYCDKPQSTHIIGCVYRSAAPQRSYRFNQIALKYPACHTFVTLPVCDAQMMKSSIHNESGSVNAAHSEITAFFICPSDSPKGDVRN